MEKKVRIAHWCFMASVISWIITMAVTPVGGWCESNPFREYYMSAFCITGIMTLITMIICYIIEKKPKYVDVIQGTEYHDYTEL